MKQVETDTCTKNYPLSEIAAMHAKKWKPDSLLEDGERVTDDVAHNCRLHDSCLGGKPQLNWSSPAIIDLVATKANERHH